MDEIKPLDTPKVGADVAKLIEILMEQCNQGVSADCFDPGPPDSGIDPRMFGGLRRHSRFPSRAARPGAPEADG